MPEGTVTPAPEGTAPAVTPEGEGTNPNDQGSTPAGADTPLDTAVMGGKYKTVGELETANKALQKELEGRPKPTPDPNEEEEDEEGSKPVTQADLKTHQAQQAETAKFNTITSKLGITGPKKEALAAYGEKPENREKSWEDLAVEIGYSDTDRVAAALGQSSDEKGGGIPGKKAATLEDAKSVQEVDEAIDDMSDEEFMTQTDALAGKTPKEGAFQY